MKYDKFSNPIFEQSDLIELIYQDKSDLFDQVLVDNDVADTFNKNSEFKLKSIPQDLYLESIEDFDSILQNQWLMPDEYKNMDIEGFLVDQCPKEHYQRLIDELQEFRSRDMINLLRWLKYFVDTCRKENIVWGVGRGSSVASYVLYLIGVHKIDSVKYNLDWQEFLR